MGASKTQALRVTFDSRLKLEFPHKTSPGCSWAGKHMGNPDHRTVAALSETRTLMAQIDLLIQDHGGWPLG